LSRLRDKPSESGSNRCSTKPPRESRLSQEGEGGMILLASKSLFS
jgi:hypothetical protein